MLIWCLSILLVIATHVYADTVRPESVLSVVTADLDGDGSLDRAVLIASETEGADLLIYLSEDPNKMRLAVSKKNIAWVLRLAGTLPMLAITERGSLVITSGTEGPQSPEMQWNTSLTVVYRNNAFVVAGYTSTKLYRSFPSENGSCDVNLLTGKGVVNKKPFETPAKAVALTDWSEDSVPQECW
jgi:hypothetical protein